jgi:hypothetical protein
MKEAPKAHNSESAREIEKAKSQFDAFDANLKEMTLDRMNEAPKQETEPQTKLSQNEIANSKDIYLKPKRYISSRERFNENFREDYEYAKQYVQFIAENKELIGETMELWTKPFAGVPAEEWAVPANKPIWGPRYLAEQINRKYYHRLVMQENRSAGSGGFGEQYYGAMAADTTISRLEARPVSNKRTTFFGSSGKFD